ECAVILSRDARDESQPGDEKKRCPFHGVEPGYIDGISNGSPSTTSIHVASRSIFSIAVTMRPFLPIALSASRTNVLLGLAVGDARFSSLAITSSSTPAL